MPEWAGEGPLFNRVHLCQKSCLKKKGTTVFFSEICHPPRLPPLSCLSFVFPIYVAAILSLATPTCVCSKQIFDGSRAASPAFQRRFCPVELRNRVIEPERDFKAMSR